MKKLWEKKEYVAFGIVIALFAFVSVTSFSSIRLLQGNARVVNYVGIVRGATQKLVKEEIMGWYLSQVNPSFRENSKWYPDDKLIERLDSIVEELLTGVGPNGLVVLHDETYLSDMRQVRMHWGVLKELIAGVRLGKNPRKLFESSQEYFELVNRTVFSAENYSESQVNRIYRILVIVNGAFIGLIALGLAFFLSGLAAKRRADALGEIAYVDPLTKLNNRASCELRIERLKKPAQSTPVAAVMFDMNDLKLTNDFLGHQGGDRVIAAFAGILQKSASEYGFVGRYGGDEFLALFESPGAAVPEAFLDRVGRQVDGFNERQVNALEMIHYSAGYSLADAHELDIEDIIHEADNRMYENKRRAKKVR